MENNIPKLKTENLEVGYKGTTLLTVPDLTLNGGEVVALIGQNGVGKSTMLRTLTREQKPINGKISIEGHNIATMSRRTLAKKVAVVTTDRDISSGLLAREIVAMGRHPHSDLLSKFSKQDLNIVDQAMQQTGIIHKADNFFGELSDGERQKVLIARALAQQTPVMILDEPFSFLDTAARIEILRLLTDVAKLNNTAILFSSHDVAQALRMADYVWLITPERKFLTGTPQELIESHDIEKLFNSKNVQFDTEQSDFIAKK